MEEKLASILEKITDLIESDNYKAYKFFANRLLFIDKDEKINMQVKLGHNNYYIKDNINNLTYIKTKKYLDDDTKLEQILMIDGTDKEYYSYIERDLYTSLARVIKTHGKDKIVCTNTNIADQNWKDILQYSYSIFEFENDDDIEEDDEYDDPDDAEYEEPDDDEYDDLDETESNNPTDPFEKFTLISNGIEMEGNEKNRMVYILGQTIEKKFYDSSDLDQVISDLKLVIESKNKKDELEK